MSHDAQLDDLATAFGDTEATFKFDAIVAAAAERFRESRWAGGYDLTDVAAVANDVQDDLPGTDQVHELLSMLDQAARLER